MSMDRRDFAKTTAAAVAAGLLKDVAYQSRTPDFWNAMDMIGGPTVINTGRKA